MIYAVVLAAGRSERMGEQKLLLPLDGKPTIAKIVAQLERAQVSEIIVVLGRDGGKVQPALQGHAVRFVTNPDFCGEMLGSIRCGLHAIPDGCEAMLIVLGDQPRLSSQVVRQLIAAFQAGGQGIIVPTHNGHRGHPLLIATRFREEILNRHDGVGLRGLLEAHPEEVHRLEVADASVLEDMDTPEDYRRYQSEPSRRLEPAVRSNDQT